MEHEEHQENMATETAAPPTPEQQALSNLVQMAHAFVDAQAAILLRVGE